MGFDAVEEKALWEKYRDHFPVADRFVYLNHAAVSPLCKAAADAMKGLADDVWQFGSYHYDRWLEAYDGLRAAAAGVIGASPGEIAIVKNTSEGIATVANGIAWKPGDRIVCFTGEFPANVIPWLELQKRGVTVEQIAPDQPLEAIEKAAKGARLVALSFVQFLSGYRSDLVAVGEICRRAGAFFFVDAIQGLGAFPIAVEAAKIDALSADGHKWLMGPEGCGVLYVRKDRQDEVAPSEWGWTNVAGYNSYSTRDYRLRSDAGRYECGTLNTIGCFGLRASYEFVASIGVERIGRQVQANADRLAAGAAAKGYELLAERTPATGAGIVSVRKPGLDARMVVRDLESQNIVAAPRHGWVRMSPHFYLSPESLERAIQALP